jgi:hypothetical protein
LTGCTGGAAGAGRVAADPFPIIRREEILSGFISILLGKS